jgi:hypothetical protein
MLAYNGYSFCFVVVLVGVTVIAQIIANSQIALLRSMFSHKNGKKIDAHLVPHQIVAGIPYMPATILGF